jgi:hypothetical protein
MANKPMKKKSTVMNIFGTMSKRSCHKLAANSRIRATVAASRWNSKARCWEYHLEGFPGWTKQNLIK